MILFPNCSPFKIENEFSCSLFGLVRTFFVSQKLKKKRIHCGCLFVYLFLFDSKRLELNIHSFAKHEKCPVDLIRLVDKRCVYVCAFVCMGVSVVSCRSATTTNFRTRDSLCVCVRAIRLWLDYCLFSLKKLSCNHCWRACECVRACVCLFVRSFRLINVRFAHFVSPWKMFKLMVCVSVCSRADWYDDFMPHLYAIAKAKETIKTTTTNGIRLQLVQQQCCYCVYSCARVFCYVDVCVLTLLQRVGSGIYNCAHTHPYSLSIGPSIYDIMAS